MSCTVNKICKPRSPIITTEVKLPQLPPLPPCPSHLPSRVYVYTLPQPPCVRWDHLCPDCPPCPPIPPCPPAPPCPTTPPCPPCPGRPGHPDYHPPAPTPPPVPPNTHNPGVVVTPGTGSTPGSGTVVPDNGETGGTSGGGTTGTSEADLAIAKRAWASKGPVGTTTVDANGECTSCSGARVTKCVFCSNLTGLFVYHSRLDRPVSSPTIQGILANNACWGPASGAAITGMVDPVDKVCVEAVATGAVQMIHWIANGRSLVTQQTGVFRRHMGPIHTLNGGTLTGQGSGANLKGIYKNSQGKQVTFHGPGGTVSV